MSDQLINAREDVEKMEHVDIIASGYEWICPNCEHLNHEIEVLQIVKCELCNKQFTTNPAEHAHG